MRRFLVNKSLLQSYARYAATSALPMSVEGLSMDGEEDVDALPSVPLASDTGIPSAELPHNMSSPNSHFSPSPVYDASVEEGDGPKIVMGATVSSVGAAGRDRREAPRRNPEADKLASDIIHLDQHTRAMRLAQKRSVSAAELGQVTTTTTSSTDKPTLQYAAKKYGIPKVVLTPVEPPPEVQFRDEREPATSAPTKGPAGPSPSTTTQDTTQEDVKQYAEAEDAAGGDFSSELQFMGSSVNLTAVAFTLEEIENTLFAAQPDGDDGVSKRAVSASTDTPATASSAAAPPPPPPPPPPPTPPAPPAAAAPTSSHEPLVSAATTGMSSVGTTEAPVTTKLNTAPRQLHSPNEGQSTSPAITMKREQKPKSVEPLFAVEASSADASAFTITQLYNPHSTRRADILRQLHAALTSVEAQIAAATSASHVGDSATGAVNEPLPSLAVVRLEVSSRGAAGAAAGGFGSCFGDDEIAQSPLERLQLAEAQERLLHRVATATAAGYRVIYVINSETTSVVDLAASLALCAQTCEYVPASSSRSGKQGSTAAEGNGTPPDITFGFPHLLYGSFPSPTAVRMVSRRLAALSPEGCATLNDALHLPSNTASASPAGEVLISRMHYVEWSRLYDSQKRLPGAPNRLLSSSFRELPLLSSPNETPSLWSHLTQRIRTALGFPAMQQTTDAVTLSNNTGARGRTSPLRQMEELWHRYHHQAALQWPLHGSTASPAASAAWRDLLMSVYTSAPAENAREHLRFLLRPREKAAETASSPATAPVVISIDAGVLEGLRSLDEFPAVLDSLEEQATTAAAGDAVGSASDVIVTFSYDLPHELLVRALSAWQLASRDGGSATPGEDGTRANMRERRRHVVFSGYTPELQEPLSLVRSAAILTPLPATRAANFPASEFLLEVSLSTGYAAVPADVAALTGAVTAFLSARGIPCVVTRSGELGARLAGVLAAATVRYPASALARLEDDLNLAESAQDCVLRWGGGEGPALHRHQAAALARLASGDGVDPTEMVLLCLADTCVCALRDGDVGSAAELRRLSTAALGLLPSAGGVLSLADAYFGPSSGGLAHAVARMTTIGADHFPSMPTLQKLVKSGKENFSDVY